MGTKDELEGDERFAVEEATGLSLYRPESRLRVSIAASEEQDLIAALEESNRVRLFAFDESVRSIPDLDALSEPSEGRDATQLGDALRGLWNEMGSEPVAAVVLFTDGRSTGGTKWADALETYAARGVPVHAVRLGRERVPKNIAVRKLVGPDVAALGFPIRIDARVDARGVEQKRLRVVLRRSAIGARGARTKVFERDLDVVNGEVDEALTFYDQLEVKGTYQYKISVARRADETNLRDNHRAIKVVAADETARVLLLAGSSTYEYRYLRNFLLRDEGIQASCWLASADRSYIQDGDVPLRSLPQSEAELRAFDVVILLDPTPTVLSSALLDATPAARCGRRRRSRVRCGREQFKAGRRQRPCEASSRRLSRDKWWLAS